MMRASEPLALLDGQDLRADNETARSDKPDWWTSDEWSTPLDVFERISDAFGPFDLDALAQPWTGRVWVNPPYSDPAPWIQKAMSSVVSGNAARVVMLLPASTDTNWFHELVLPFADVVFVKGRVKFLGWKGTPIGSPKAGSIIAVFPKASDAFSLRTTRRSCRPEKGKAVTSAIEASSIEHLPGEVKQARAEIV